MDWHRRETKAAWWDYFRVRELDDDDLLDEPTALVRLAFVERVEVVIHSKTGKPTGSVVDRYRFPPQEMDIGTKSMLTLREGTTFGSVVARSRERREIDIKKGPARAGDHADTLFATTVVGTEVLQRAVMNLAAEPDVLTCGLDVLHRRPPRLTGGSLARQPSEPEGDAAVRLVLSLDRSAIAIQGPPGSGKTYTGARMIRALVQAGKRVGVTAVSHKVIRNLLDAVADQAAKAGETVRLGQKVRQGEDDAGPCVAFHGNDGALAALRAGEIDVLGGTAWLWADPDSAGAVDVLFVDEAGQLSLANTLAVSQAAWSLVLLGDPQQLEQPQKGSHPDGVGVSALEHILGGAKTIPDDRGLFLPITWRLAPPICDFTSEVFYERRLLPLARLEHQRLAGVGAFDGAGLWLVEVAHEGNQNSSSEEVDAVRDIVGQLLREGATWVNAQGVARAITATDFRVVAPYNAQVNRLAERLGPLGVPVGTVDKFQGQEAPVVIYSMATSRPEDAPRGMEFLYSVNRMNVATSRARCAAIVVASPRLFEPECRTPRQMQLANALCRFKEMARRIQLTGG